MVDVRQALYGRAFAETDTVFHVDPHEETASDVDVALGDVTVGVDAAGETRLDSLHDAAFGPLNERAKQGLARKKKEEEARATAEALGSSGNAVAADLGSEFHADAGVDASGRVVTGESPRSSGAQSDPAFAERRPTREEAARAKEVEKSFRGQKKKSGFPIKLVIAVVAVVVLGAGGVLLVQQLGGLARVAPDGFVRIEPGRFTMGSPEDEPGRSNDEMAHEVRITRPFALQTTEVTQAEWTALMYSQPDQFENCGETCPMTNVSWHDAVRFANRRSISENLEPCYVVEGNDVSWPEGLDCEGYRLPTEAEWEYATRAGTDSAFANGEIMNTGRELLDPRLALIGWYGANSDADYIGAVDCSSWGEDRHSCGPQPVQGRRVNPWGLYDVHGNVAEWVWDRYGPYEGPEIDPTGTGAGSAHVIRGGSWRGTSEACRSAARDRSSSVGRNNVGFRLARSLR